MRVFCYVVLGTCLVGCIEVDGPDLGIDTSRICPGGALKRSPIGKHVLDALEPCCDGTAHWVPEPAVPSEFHDMLQHNPTTKTFCVPDIMAIDPNRTPMTCTSLFGQPGACISSCIESVSKAPIPLPRDVCQGNELCAPCIDPRDGSESGACRLGLLSCRDRGPCRDYEPTLDLSPYPPCCEGGAAHCALTSLVPLDQQKDLAGCSVGGGTGFCVPDKFLLRGGRYTPRQCKSLGGREGRCLSVCVVSVQKDMHSLPQDVCETDERCAPCYDPRTGYGTGACTVGHCDPGPSDPPATFEPCGMGGSAEALCIPKSSVPLDERCNFDIKGCMTQPCKGADELCVPKKVVDAGPSFMAKVCYNDLVGFLALFKTVFKEPFKALQAMSEYREGRCLSRCLPKVRDKADLLGRAGCDEDEVCVPCFDPEKLAEGKIPTGACIRPSCPTPSQ